MSQAKEVLELAAEIQEDKETVNPVQPRSPSRCIYCGSTKHAEENCEHGIDSHDALMLDNQTMAYLKGALAYLEIFKKARPDITVTFELVLEGVRFKLRRPYMSNPLDQMTTVPWKDFGEAKFNPLIAILDSLVPPNTATGTRRA